MSTTPILVSDSPNDGRNKINANFLATDNELLLCIKADGSIGFTSDQDMGSHRLTGLTTDLNNPTDALNVASFRVGLGVVSKYKYIEVSANHVVSKVMYADDGATVIGYADDTLVKALSHCDGTSWWLINIMPDYSPIEVIDFNLYGKNFVKFIGYGKPKVNFIGDMTCYGYYENLRLFTDQANTHVSLSRYSDCDIWFDDPLSGPRALFLDDKVMMNQCKLVCASNGYIVLGTGGSFHIHNNEMSVDLTGLGVNDANAMNLISSDLKTRLEEILND